MGDLVVWMVWAVIDLVSRLWVALLVGEFDEPLVTQGVGRCQVARAVITKLYP